MTMARSTTATVANRAANRGKTTGASASHKATASAEQTSSPNVASTIRRVSALASGSSVADAGERVAVALSHVGVSNGEPVHRPDVVPALVRP